jgi:hypothetical protein
MKTISRAFGAALALSLVMCAADASARGLFLDGTELPESARASLRSEIDAARAQTPALFRQVHDVAARANALDEASRLPGAPLTRHFKNLGPRALMPMLEMLAFEAHAPRDLSPSASAALRLGLLEAVGSVGDARAVPVLSRVLSRERDATVTRASAEALARIGTDEAVRAAAAALEAAKGDPQREQAILEGLGEARRESVARLLAARLDARPDARTAEILARSLGGTGNAWAWRTMSDRREEAKTRDAAARALVHAYLRYSGPAQKAITKAILLVDAPQTLTYIGQARRGASSDQAEMLALLELRIASNPAR